MIEIDGSKGEGGGQILRSALTLSLLTGKPFKLEHIRAKRAKPGLMPQHLKAVQAAAEVGSAQVKVALPGSLSLSFNPGQVRPGCYLFDIGTAGATSLVLQTIYLPLAMAQAPSSVTIKGGTHVPFSPCFHYLDWHWRRVLETAGLKLSLAMERSGFYPPGGGIVHAEIQAQTKIKPLRFKERGRLVGVRGVSGIANLGIIVAERQRDEVLKKLAHRISPCRIEIEFLNAPSKGTVLLLLAEFEHSQACFFALGERGKRAEQVADEAADALLAFLATDGAIDPYLADQLLLPLAFAPGESLLHTSRLTGHILTNAEIIRTFLPVRLEIEGLMEQPATVRVGGVRLGFGTIINAK